MTVTQQGQLTKRDELILQGFVTFMKRQEQEAAEWRDAVADVIGRSSYREVSRVTGVSTNTLQRWKREAGK